MLTFVLGSHKETECILMPSSTLGGLVPSVRFMCRVKLNLFSAVLTTGIPLGSETSAIPRNCGGNYKNCKYIVFCTSTKTSRHIILLLADSINRLYQNSCTSKMKPIVIKFHFNCVLNN